MHNFRLFFLIFPCFVFSQSKAVVSIQGELVNDKADVSGINITNSTTSQTTKSAKFGFFTINGSVGDTLVVSSVQFEKVKYVIQRSNVEKKQVFIPLKIENTTLEEVEIELLKKINSQSLGLVSKNQKTYTPAERKLRAAGELHWYSPLLIPIGGLDFDGLLNAITGRTKQLKKEVAIEKKELALLKIAENLKNSYFTDDLKISENSVEGFKYYLVDDIEFIEAVENKNWSLAKFIAETNAKEFNRINKD